MVGEQELHCPLAHLIDFWVVGRDLHPLGGRCGASRGQAAQSLDLDDTQTARAVRFKFGIIAERRYVDIRGTTGVEHRFSILNRDCTTVNH